MFTKVHYNFHIMLIFVCQTVVPISFCLKTQFNLGKWWYIYAWHNFVLNVPKLFRCSDRDLIASISQTSMPSSQTTVPPDNLTTQPGDEFPGSNMSSLRPQCTNHSGHHTPVTPQAGSSLRWCTRKWCMSQGSYSDKDHELELTTDTPWNSGNVFLLKYVN